MQKMSIQAIGKFPKLVFNFSEFSVKWNLEGMGEKLCFTNVWEGGITGAKTVNQSCHQKKVERQKIKKNQ